jgi:Skp family chaperone for outer membrane proteins
MRRAFKHYLRAEQVRTDLERASVSEEQRRMKREVAVLERESGQQGFWFRRRRQTNEELEAKRTELQKVMQRDAERVRGLEGKAVENLMADVRNAIESVGREEELAIIFDSALPQILYVNSDVGMAKDVTDRTIERLNSR